MRKIIVAGSRDYDNFEQLEYNLMMYFKREGLHRADVEIVSGAARGADKLGEQLAKKYGLALTQFPADWDKYGKSAGYRRNAEMAKYADVLFAFWDGKSKGTQHMINLAKESKLEVHVLLVAWATADDEEPDCEICDYVTQGTREYCSNCAGSWGGYRRTLIAKEIEI